MAGEETNNDFPEGAPESAPFVPSPSIAAAAAAGVPAPNDAAIAALPGAEIPDKDWRRGGLIIVGKHSIPKDEKRPVIIVEAYAPAEGVDENNNTTADYKPPQVKTEDYPTKGDLYYRTDPSVVFPDGVPVITLGEEVQQLALWGLCADPRYVCVGPASAIYGAANLVFSRFFHAGGEGSCPIEIRGATKEEQARLQPYLDRIATDPIVPADVNITFA